MKLKDISVIIGEDIVGKGWKLEKIIFISLAIKNHKQIKAKIITNPKIYNIFYNLACYVQQQQLLKAWDVK